MGKALLARIEKEATRLGVEKLYANVSVTAESFFSARGFVVTEARNKMILGHPAPNFAMEKILGN